MNRCVDCKKAIPEVPWLFYGKKAPLCFKDFRRRRSLGRRNALWRFLARWGLA